MEYIEDRMRFIGNIEAKADAKGRVFLPAAFRKVLGSEDPGLLVLRKDIFQPCLVLYPEQVWNEQTDRLRQRLNRWNEHHQQVFRQFVSDAELLSLDANGRLLIPRRYLEMAGIRQDIKFIGVDDTIEVWSREATMAPFVDAAEFAKTIAGVMEDAGSQTEP